MQYLLFLVWETRLWIGELVVSFVDRLTPHQDPSKNTQSQGVQKFIKYSVKIIIDFSVPFSENISAKHSIDYLIFVEILVFKSTFEPN